MEIDQATAIEWIRNPVGSNVPYDFVRPEHLEEFLKGACTGYKIADDLSWIVAEVKV